MKRPTKAGHLTPSPVNPRTITEQDLAELGTSMRELGDLGGIVFNRRTGNLVGGTQRRRNIPDDAAIEVAHRYRKPTAAGTVAIGTIDVDGERFSYREVDWPLEVERIANLRANNPAGDWDEGLLADAVRAIGTEGRLEATGFDKARLDALLGVVKGSNPDPGDDRYREQYGVIVICRDEPHQRGIFEELRNAGHEVRVVVT